MERHAGRLLLRVGSGVDAVRPVRSPIVEISGSLTIPRQSPFSPSSDEDAYIETCPESSRARLIMLRTAIRDEAPHATERIAYGTATWHDGETIIHIGGYARHVGLYPGSGAMVVFADEVEGFVTSKGAIQFPHDRELPLGMRCTMRDLWCRGRRRGQVRLDRSPGVCGIRPVTHREVVPPAKRQVRSRAADLLEASAGPRRDLRDASGHAPPSPTRTV